MSCPGKAATSAFNKFVGRYTALAAQPPCTATLTPAPGPFLPPGVYCSVAGVTFTGVTLTLQGPVTGTWIFKIGTGGTGALTGTGFVVTMAGAKACNVTWWVAEGATMTDSNLKGSVLAGAAVSLTRGTFNGNALAHTDVTITGTAVTGC